MSIFKASDDVRLFTDVESDEFGLGFFHKKNKYVHHSPLHHSDTAYVNVTLAQGFFVSILVITLLYATIISWSITLLTVIAVLTFLYFADLLFNLFLIIRSFAKSPELKVTQEEINEYEKEHEWPTYTIFCPLYKEWQVVPQFVKAMTDLDYPTNKMQVMLLLESDDEKTIEEVQKSKLPSNFTVVVVPHSMPKTKPKALNYGLRHATGEYVVIYDAEDVPEPLQLKKTVLAFSQVSKKTVCIQAKLNFYNPHQNILTKAFTAEYSLWFDLVLTGLQSINAPIPLGGTSNHFRKADLHTLKGWDSFNVTEDCDLGIRLARHGFTTAIVDSTTYEEANSDLGNWMNQRTRWIKGYIQTYFVHSRNPFKLLKGVKLLNYLSFQIIVGGKVISMLINPIMWILTILYFILRPIYGNFLEAFFPAPVLYMAVTCLFLGNFLYMYYYAIGCAKRGYFELVKYSIFTPLYWLAMSLSAYRAFLDFTYKPHFWHKTKHGLHMNT